MRTLGRVFLIPLALLASAIASGFVLVTLGLERVTSFLHIQSEGDVDALLGLLNQGLILITGVTVVPALVVVLIGEIANIRSAIYYNAGGGAAFAVIPLLASYGQSGSFILPEPTVWQVLATAGFAGGFVYWLLAGRTA